MSQLVFVVHPRILPAMLPMWLRRLPRYAVASLVVYWLLIALSRLGVLALSERRLLWACVIIAPLLAFVTIKHHLVRLHRTKYLFYESHVVEEFSFLIRKRHSVPYSQITKVETHGGIWNRLTGVGDLLLHASDDGSVAMRLRAIKDPHDVEHRIYSLLHQKPSSATNDS